MKKNKFLMYIIIISLILIIGYLGYLVYININYNNNLEEIIPEEELSDENLRKTIITLYFLNSENNTLIPEARQIDSKKLLNNPYKFLVELLIEGPQNNKLIKLIPENTKINNIDINNEIVEIDFSEDFITEENLGKEKEKLIINSILKTLIELTEVKGIKILINGEENLAFKDGEINFESVFEI